MFVAKTFEELKSSYPDIRVIRLDPGKEKIQLKIRFNPYAQTLVPIMASKVCDYRGFEFFIAKYPCFDADAKSFTDRIKAVPTNGGYIIIEKKSGVVFGRRQPTFNNSAKEFSKLHIQETVENHVKSAGIDLLDYLRVNTEESEIIRESQSIESI